MVHCGRHRFERSQRPRVRKPIGDFMTAEPIRHSPNTIAVAKDDLVAAWSVLEDLAVSLHKIGSAFAVKEDGQDLSRSDRQRMLETLDAYLSPERFEQISKA